MTCHIAKDLLVGYLKRELDADIRKEFEEHLAQCPSCRDELAKASRIMSWVDAASSDSAVRRVNDIVATSLASKASDIHLDPMPDGGLRIRMRVDGVLQDLDPIQALERDGIMSRLKMLANIEMSSDAVTQSGRWRTEIDGKPYDFRIAVVPYVLGEGIVIRILDASAVSFGLDKLNMAENHMALVQKWLKVPCGIVLVCGPTGSGKTTNAYSMIESLSSDAVKVVSVEDPVEYLLKGVSQIQVNRKQGFTYAEAIRLLMRSDPDVIYVADLNGLDTVEMLYFAAANGHLCIANMSSNSPFDAIDRLLNMGMEPYALAETIIGITSQRLIRKVCKNCSTRLDETPESICNTVIGRYFELTPEEVAAGSVMAAVGCEECRGTGHRGRTAIYEMLDWSRVLGETLVSSRDSRQVRERAVKEGFADLKHHGRQMILSGVSSLEEVFRVVSSSI